MRRRPGLRLTTCHITHPRHHSRAQPLGRDQGVPHALDGPDLHPAGDGEDDAGHYLEYSNDDQEPLEPGLGPKDADEEHGDRYPSQDGAHDAGREGHPYPLGDVDELVKGQVGVVLAEAVAEGDSEA